MRCIRGEKKRPFLLQMCDPIGQNGKLSKTKKNRIWQLVGETQGVFSRCSSEHSGWCLSKAIKPCWNQDWTGGKEAVSEGGGLSFRAEKQSLPVCPLGREPWLKIGRSVPELRSGNYQCRHHSGLPTLETYERLNARADGMWWWGKVRQMVDKIRHLQRQSWQMGAGVKLDKWLQGQGDTSKTACGLDRKHTLRLRGHKNNGPVQEDNWFYFKRCWKCFKIYI